MPEYPLCRHCKKPITPCPVQHSYLSPCNGWTHVNAGHWCMLSDKVKETQAEPEPAVPAQCAHTQVYYSREDSNFYCFQCKKGMGQEYFNAHVHEAEKYPTLDPETKMMKVLVPTSALGDTLLTEDNYEIRPVDSNTAAKVRQLFADITAEAESTGYNFDLGSPAYRAELAKFVAWNDEHIKTCTLYDDGSSPVCPTGAMGGRLTFSFSPHNLGVNVKVKCACGEVVDVTDYENF